jgi:small-conductance mechanosensitive channel
LAIWKPFDVGDHVTIVAWQYPVLAPTFPHEAVLPGYSGRITDMDVMYTKCITDDGVPMVIPNGVMVSAAIQNHARAGSFRHRWRFDVTLDLDPRAALTAVEAALDRAASSVGLDPQSVAGYVEATDIGTAVFSIVVHFHVASTQEQRLRAAIVREVACGIRALRAPADAVPKA